MASAIAIETVAIAFSPIGMRRSRNNGGLMSHRRCKYGNLSVKSGSRRREIAAWERPSHVTPRWQSGGDRPCGDSRLYRLTVSGGLELLTRDHELGQQSIAQGLIRRWLSNPSSLSTHPSPQPRESVRPDIRFLPVLENTLFLLALMAHRSQFGGTPLENSPQTLFGGLGKS